MLYDSSPIKPLMRPSPCWNMIYDVGPNAGNYPLVKPLAEEADQPTTVEEKPPGMPEHT